MFENVIFKMVVILSQPQCFKQSTIMFDDTLENSWFMSDYFVKPNA